MALNAFQKAVQKLAQSMGLHGDAEQKVYATPEYTQLVGKFFGQIDLPAGITEDMVTYRTPFHLEYKDQYGYTHKLERNLDGRSPSLGQVKELSTDRPAVLPLEKSNPGIEQAMKLLTERTSVPFSQTLPDLDPASRAQLDAIAKANQDQLNQLFERGRGDLVTGLYGSGTNRSTLANDAAARLAQEQGLVQSNKLSEDATRELNLRTGLRGQNIQLREQDINYLMGLLGQDTARAVPSAQLSADQAKLAENSRQFDLQYLLEQEKMKQAQKSQLMSVLSGIASAGLSLIPGAGPFLAAGAGSISGGLTGGKKPYSPVGPGE
jgi:hypothetical protein